MLEPTPHELAALRDGNLSLILRPVVPQPPENAVDACYIGEYEHGPGVAHTFGWFFPGGRFLWPCDLKDRSPCPLGQPGDVLAVREEWALDDCRRPFYRIDGAHLLGPNPMRESEWQPADTMPDWAVRYRPRVASVRCLRVQELSDADVLATGHIEGRTLGAPLRARMRNLLHYHRMRKDDDPDWSGNPYIWAVSVEQ